MQQIREMAAARFGFKHASSFLLFWVSKDINLQDRWFSWNVLEVSINHSSNSRNITNGEDLSETLLLCGGYQSRCWRLLLFVNANFERQHHHGYFTISRFFKNVKISLLLVPPTIRNISSTSMPLQRKWSGATGKGRDIANSAKTCCMLSSCVGVAYYQP